MRRIRAEAVIVIALCVALVLLAGCGSGSSKVGGTSPASAKTGTSTAAAGTVLIAAGPAPSESAKMVCATEARNAIASTLGISETRVVVHPWVDHIYSCTYVYPKGSFTLSVKEVSSWKETADYYDSLARKYGQKSHGNLPGLGQGAFVAKNNDVVVRKDWKILTVDVSKVPPNFVPAMTTSDVATNVAATLLSCWTGA